MMAAAVAPKAEAIEQYQVPYVGGRQVMKQQKKIWDKYPLTKTQACSVEILAPKGESRTFHSQPRGDKSNDSDDEQPKSVTGDTIWKANMKAMGELERSTTHGGQRWSDGGQLVRSTS